MARQSPSAGLKTIIGYILPEQEVVQSNQDDVSVSEDEDDQEIQPEFLDMKEMDSVSSGANLFKSSVPASKEGKTTYQTCFLWYYENKVSRCKIVWNNSRHTQQVNIVNLCVQ